VPGGPAASPVPVARLEGLARRAPAERQERSVRAVRQAALERAPAVAALPAGPEQAPAAVVSRGLLEPAPAAQPRRAHREREPAVEPRAELARPRARPAAGRVVRAAQQRAATRAPAPAPAPGGRRPAARRAVAAATAVERRGPAGSAWPCCWARFSWPPGGAQRSVRRLLGHRRGDSRPVVDTERRARPLFSLSSWASAPAPARTKRRPGPASVTPFSCAELYCP